MGINIKYFALSLLNNEIIQNGEGLGIDFGLTYDLRNTQGTIASFGLAIKNVNTDIRLDNSFDDSVTRTFDLGVAYQKIKDTRLEIDYDIADQSLQNTDLHNQLRIGAERFFNDRLFSVRIGYDDLFYPGGSFTLGASYCPNQPYELSYALQISTSNSQFSHFLSFVYRFDQTKKSEAYESTPVGISSAEITIGPASSLLTSPVAAGNPVSVIPLRKMNLLFTPSIFSPSGEQKTTTLSFPNDSSLNVSRWLVEFESSDGKSIRRIAGTGPLLPSLIWDGNDDMGKPSGEGTYRVVLKTFDKNDGLLSNDSTSVEITSVRSTFSLSTNDPYYSNFGGKNKEANILIRVNPGGSPDVKNWKFEISDSDNKSVYENHGFSKLPLSLKWNGTDRHYRTVPDGVYTCQLSAMDLAGNYIKTDVLEIFIQNSGPELSLATQNRLVDFNSQKYLNLELNSTDPVGIANWKVLITGENGELLKTFGDLGEVPKEILWDGIGVTPGMLVKSVFEATDRAGNTTITEPCVIQVDYKPPVVGEQLTLNLTTVNFEDAKYDLSKDAKEEIEKSTMAIKPYLNKSTILVKGYASTGNINEMLTLSHERALEVKKFLADLLQIPVDSIYSVGYANQEPVTTLGTPGTGNLNKAIISITTHP